MYYAVFRMSRGMFLAALSPLLLGINVYGWAAVGINHVLIFNLNPRCDQCSSRVGSCGLRGCPALHALVTSEGRVRSTQALHAVHGVG